MWLVCRQFIWVYTASALSESTDQTGLSTYLATVIPEVTPVSYEIGYADIIVAEDKMKAMSQYASYCKVQFQCEVNFVLWDPKQMLTYTKITQVNAK